MPERITANTLVEIQRIVLAPGERAPQVPEETQQVPLVMRVKGFLVNDASLGERVEVQTPAGRRLQGTLVDESPAYTHTFGPRIDALSHIGAELRELLRDCRKTR